MSRIELAPTHTLRVCLCFVTLLALTCCEKRRHDDGRVSASATSASSLPSAVVSVTTPPPSDDAVIAPTFATLRFVLTATMPPCTAADCHGPGGPNRLQYRVKDPDALYETITHHMSVDCGNIPVVTPGNPEKSALVKVLKGPCSAKVPQMPNGCQPALGNCLPANYVSAIERWIALGAPKN